MPTQGHVLPQATSDADQASEGQRLCFSVCCLVGLFIGCFFVVVCVCVCLLLFLMFLKSWLCWVFCCWVGCCYLCESVGVGSCFVVVFIGGCGGCTEHLVALQVLL